MALTLDTLKQAYDAIVDRGWTNVSLTDIAKATDMSIAELRIQLSSKYDLISALNQQIDADVLDEVGAITMEDSARDRLFEVMMARFDALEPFKDALGVMAMAARSDLHLAAQTRRSIEKSMGWMLEAAGLSAGGWKGAFRRNGLALVYVRTSLVWLKDESQDLSATMKSMDGALGDAERWANSIENASFGAGFDQVRDRMKNMADRARAARPGGQRFRGDAADDQGDEAHGDEAHGDEGSGDDALSAPTSSPSP